MATTGGKAYLMVLHDILELAESPEYSSHPKQQPGELVGFTVPDWMIDKMRAYIETAKTNPETTDEELLRIAEEYAEMEEEGRQKKSCSGEVRTPPKREDSELSIDCHFMSAVPGRAGTPTDSDHGSAQHQAASQQSSVAQLLQEIKGEQSVPVDEDLQNLDPGFL